MISREIRDAFIKFDATNDELEPTAANLENFAAEFAKLEKSVEYFLLNR